jgi:hypothetical protein
MSCTSRFSPVFRSATSAKLADPFSAFSDFRRSPVFPKISTAIISLRLYHSDAVQYCAPSTTTPRLVRIRSRVDSSGRSDQVRVPGSRRFISPPPPLPVAVWLTTARACQTVRRIPSKEHRRQLSVRSPHPAFLRRADLLLSFLPSPLFESFARSYPTKSIFLRELLSNANDALEKLRLTSLQDHDTFIGIGELNITIRAEPDRNEQGGVGRLIVKGELSDCPSLDRVSARADKVVIINRHRYRYDSR